MDIRAFDTPDTDAVVALWKACELVVPWNDPYKDIRRKLAVGPDLFLVAEVAGDIVATVMAGYEGHRGWINYLAVSPDHQGKGYGRLLVEEVESRLEERGCPKVSLQIRDTNWEAVSFYEEMGYKRENTIVLGKRLERDD